MMNASTDLRHVNIGQKFSREHHPHHGTYTVIGKPSGSIGVTVKSESGRVGELIAWTRVVPK